MRQCQAVVRSDDGEEQRCSHEETKFARIKGAPVGGMFVCWDHHKLFRDSQIFV